MGVRGPGAAQRRVQRGRRPPGRASTASSRPASTRCGAARGTSSARIADMDLNGVYASVCFPSFLPGFAGQRLQQLTDDPELALACVRAWNDWVIEEWVGVRARAHDPAAAPVPARSRGGGGRGAPQRRARLQGDDVLGGAAPARAAVAAHRALGSADGRVRGDRHRRVPARRVVGHVAGDGARRAVRHHRRAVLRVRDVRGGRLALLAHPGALPRAAHLPVAKAGSVGWPGCSTGSSTCASTTRCTARGTTSRSSPADTFRRNFWVCAIDDPSAFLQRDVIGIENILRRVRLPARRLHVAAHPGAAAPRNSPGCPTPRSRAVTWANASELFRHPVPEAVQRDPDAF